MTVLMNGRGHDKFRKYLAQLNEEILPGHLDVGDILFLDFKGNEVGIELKPVDQLLGGIRSNALFSQMSALRDGVDIAILLVYGFLTTTKEGLCRTKTGVQKSPPYPKYLEVELAMLSLSMYGIIVLPFIANEFKAADAVVRIRKWFEQPEHLSFYKRAKPMTLGDPETVQAIHIITGIRGISVKRAKALLERFGSVRGVFGATQEELMEQKGIGKVLAEAIDKAGG